MKYITINLITAMLLSSTVKSQNFLYDTILVEKAINAKKDSILSIIKMIDSKRKEQVGFVNKYSSSLNLDLSFNYSGLNYIYLLDVIFKADSLSENNNINKPAISTSLKSKYQNYPFCVLVKRNKLSFVKLNYKDLVKIKNYLNQWWKEMQYLPFDEIEDKWLLEKPLDKLGYSWK